jgi:hypothetical protein
VTEVPADLQNLGLDLTIWATTLLMLWYALRMRRAGVLK